MCRLAWLLVFIAGTAASAVEGPLDPLAAQSAVALGQSASERDRLAFHLPYRTAVGQPPLDTLDIVTPFRRLVIAAELRARVGDRRFGQREALAIAAKFPDLVGVHLEMTFHPQNTYVLVPEYRVYWVTERGTDVEAATISTWPRYVPRTGGDTLPTEPETSGTMILRGGLGPGKPMVGAAVVATFRREDLVNPKAPAREVVIEETGRGTVARLSIDLAKLR